MPKSFQDQHHDGNPTAAEIFSVFRNTTMATIAGLKLLLGECADLRGELVTLHSLHSDRDGTGVFSTRQQNRILELQEAAKDMEALLVSWPGEDDVGAADGKMKSTD